MKYVPLLPGVQLMSDDGSFPDRLSFDLRSD
jgi:hypothetical protein